MYFIVSFFNRDTWHDNHSGGFGVPTDCFENVSALSHTANKLLHILACGYFAVAITFYAHDDFTVIKAAKAFLVFHAEYQKWPI